MRSLKLRKKVAELRKGGATYREIQSKLKVSIPKSTLWYWCKNVPVPPWYAEKIEKLNWESFSRARVIAWAQTRRKREEMLADVGSTAAAIVKKFSGNDFKIILATLYLGEGAKSRGHSGLMLGNTDPNIILLYIRLLERCYRIMPQQLKCRVSYRADQNIMALERYWSSITDVPLRNFYKTKPDPRTQGKKTMRPDYKGVCVLSCAGVKIQLELEAISRQFLEKLGR